MLVVLAACGQTDPPTTDGHPPPGDAATDAPPGCACAYGTPQVAGVVESAAVAEASGLVASRALADTLWVHNDSGDAARLYAMTTAGATRGVLNVPGATATDWEDLAIAPCAQAWCLYAGDIGDNAAARPSIQIYEVDEPTTVAATADATFRAFDVSYPDGPHNAEALFVDPRDGRVYVITKQPTNPSRVFQLPLTAGVTSTAVEIGQLAVTGGTALITGADLHEDTCRVRLLVRTYTNLFELRAGAAATIAELLAAPLRPVPVASEPQGEAVAYAADGRAYTTVSEGAQPPLSRASCP